MWTVTLAAACVLAVAAVAGAATFQPDVVKALETSKNLYVATKRKDGTQSAKAPIWFMYDGNAVYFSTAPESHKAKRIASDPCDSMMSTGSSPLPNVLLIFWPWPSWIIAWMNTS